jgi:hypothetical protein
MRWKRRVFSIPMTTQRELLQQFPVEHPTPVTTEMEKRIQNRLLTGFANWNRGFDAWKAWGDILYTPESLYNVHSVHLTLKEYQAAMYGTLRRADIQMGAFHHMLVSDSWCAIRYAITTTPRGGEAVHDTVMEFVHFGDFGKDLGTRVIEGWAGTRGKDYDMLTMLQTKEEKEAQARGPAGDPLLEESGHRGPRKEVSGAAPDKGRRSAGRGHAAADSVLLRYLEHGKCFLGRCALGESCRPLR